MTYRLGLDIGGTFSDVVLLDTVTGQVTVEKRLATHNSLAESGCETVGRLLGVPHDDAQTEPGQIVHATTLVANLIVERKGEPLALLTTRGFRDVLELGRQRRAHLYDMFTENVSSLVPRRLIVEMDERVGADGSVLQPLQREQVAAVLADLVGQGVGVVAVCFLHAYLNPAHEYLVRDVAAAEYGSELLVSLSSDVAPQFREYERSSTTTLNAYAMPVTSTYLSDLRDCLERAGHTNPLYIMQSNGGITTEREVRNFPVHLVRSGAAAGVTLAAAVGRNLGYHDLLSFDMGGTTAKLATIHNGHPTVVRQFEVGQRGYKANSGMPVLVPSLDILEIGIGGNSIARCRENLIQVGPDSAGASPGPICYNRGGTQPTLTDAALVLGYVNPVGLLDESSTLYIEGAKRGLRSLIADPLKLDVIRAAWGVFEIANTQLEIAARAISSARGHDPRELTLVAFGGSGPLHATSLARALGIRRLLIPAMAGVASAVGLLVADLRFDLSQTLIGILSEQTLDVGRQLCQELASEVVARLQHAGSGLPYQLSYSVDMRFEGQGYEVEVPCPPDDDWFTPANLRDRFKDIYAAQYGYADLDADVEVVTWHVGATVPMEYAFPAKRGGAASAGEEAGQTRVIYHQETGGYFSCPIFKRAALAPGAIVAGPAIVEEVGTTILLLPDDRAHVTGEGHLVVEVAQ